MIKTIESGGWKKQAAPFIIVDDQKASILGGNILPQVEIKLVPEKRKRGNVLNIHEPEQSNPNFKEWVKGKFAQLCVRKGKSKKHVMRTQFSKDIVPIQQKGRRIAVHLQD